MAGVMSAPSLRDSYVRLCSAMFWLLLLWCAFDAHLFIATNASDIFFADDATLIDGVQAREGGWFGHWLMSLHNEHREPLPKLLWFPLYMLTDDIRSGMHAQVALLLIAAVLGRSCAVRLRGRADLADLFFPLGFLQIANHENLLMGFQLCIAVPVLLVMFVLWSLARACSEDRVWRSVATVLATAGLPMCGGYGIILTLPLTTALLWRGWSDRRTISGKTLLIGSLLPLVSLGLYFVDYESPPRAEYALSAATLLSHVPVHWSIAFGPYSTQLQGWLWYPISAALIGALLWNGSRIWKSRGSDLPACVLFCVLAAALAYGLSMSYARPAYQDTMVANRYLPFPLPFLTAVALTALTVPLLAVRFLVPLFLALAMLQAQPRGNQEAYLVGSIRTHEAMELQALADANVPTNVLAERYQQAALSADPLYVRNLLLEYHRRGIPPFQGLNGELQLQGSSLCIDTPPDTVLGDNKLILRRMDGQAVIVVRAPSQLVWQLWGNEQAFGLLMEPPLQLRKEGRAVAVPWRLEWKRPDGSIQTLAQESLVEPVSREYPVPAGATGQWMLCFDLPDEDPGTAARAWIVLLNLKMR